jgi:hypothetical protein
MVYFKNLSFSFYQSFFVLKKLIIRFLIQLHCRVQKEARPLKAIGMKKVWLKVIYLSVHVPW